MEINAEGHFAEHDQKVMGYPMKPSASVFQRCAFISAYIDNEKITKNNKRIN